LRAAVRVIVGAVGDGGRRDAWWCPDVVARPLAAWWRVALCGRCSGCVAGPMLGRPCGEQLKQGVWGCSGVVSVEVVIMCVVAHICEDLGVETEGCVDDYRPTGEKRMTGFELCGEFDRYRSAGEESDEHLWGKVELDRRREEKQKPCFPGEYRFERKVADRVPDCFVRGEGANRWIEVVAGSDQPYRAKTREALRLGFVVHWVFHTDHREQMRDARAALEPELEDPIRFGEYDPLNDLLMVGDPVTFKNYEFPVESMREFEPRSLLGYRRGAAHIARRENSYDLGMFDLAGCQRRIFTDYPQGKYFRAVAPGQAFDTATFGFPTEDGLERLVEDGKVTRLGPVRRRDAAEWAVSR